MYGERWNKVNSEVVIGCRAVEEDLEYLSLLIVLE